jgi:hypothetical protein
MDETETANNILTDWISGHFGLIQIGVSAFFILLWVYTRVREDSKSRFKLREADRNDLHFKRGQEAHTEANKPSRRESLKLGGIVKDGAAHEVIGISALANEAEIQKAYKEKMKRYHPDALGPPGSREWNEGTEIAEAINRARNTMLEKLKKRTGKSGR